MTPFENTATHLPTIWVDLTTSMVNARGVIGIVRVELEFAAGLYKQRKNVRFFMVDENRAKEITVNELDWLLESTNIGDSYMRFKNGKTLQAIPEAEPIGSRLLQLRVGRHNVLRALPRSLRVPLRLATAPLVALGIFASKVLAVSCKLVRARSGNFSRTPPRDTIQQVTPSQEHPFSDGDIIFSCGYVVNNKEEVLERIKTDGTRILLCYYIYDLIPILDQTRHFYSDGGILAFENYFKWVSNNCDFIIYGGRTTQEDSVRMQRKLKLPIPHHAVVNAGCEIVKRQGSVGDNAILEMLGIRGPYLLAVGSIEGRKNHETLYRAFRILIEQLGDNAPQMVFAGKPDAYSTSDLIDTLRRDPNIAGRLILHGPTDEELDVLYRNATFCVLASVYEGWSVVVAETLNYGKFCICSNVPPLREVAGDCADYVEPFDVMAWVSSIRFYLEHPYDLQERILRVERGWKGAPWVQSSKNLANEIDSLYRNKIASRELWMDISLSYLLDHGGLTGIVRTELVLAQELHRLCPSIRFFACDRGRFFEISKVYLEWLFESENLTADLAAFNQRMNDYVSRGGSRSPIRHPSPVSPNAVTKTSPESIPVIDRALLHKGLHQIASVFPQKYVRKLLDRTDYLKEAETAIETSTEQKAENEGSTQSEAQSDATELFFPDNSIIFTAGLDGEMTTTKALKRLRNRDSLYLVQIMYDFTPIITPHLHVDFVPSMYRRYFSTMSKEVNLFLYGGENAKRDGMEFQKKNMLPITKGVAIKFGGNIAKNNDSLPEGLRVLRDLGIHGKFLLSVGTLENRKNHDTLYKAYLELLKRGIDVPQMVFIGGPGWHTKDFMNRITRDDRVKGKILIMRATDTQLNTLYHHCEFTLLASLYEGWSLTLPESFEAGKFCLCSDVAPLREVGRDLIDYVHPWDAIGWADKIQYYLENPQKLRAKETKIESEWQTYTWSSCAKNILDIIQRESGAVLELNE